MSAPDPFAFGGRQDADAELYRLIVEYRSAEDALNATHDDDDGSGRLCELLTQILYKINKFVPATLAGVMAALDFADNCGEEPDMCWPTGAIEGLRALIKQRAA